MNRMESKTKKVLKSEMIIENLITSLNRQEKLAIIILSDISKFLDKK